MLFIHKTRLLVKKIFRYIFYSASKRSGARISGVQHSPRTADNARDDIPVWVESNPVSKIVDAWHASLSTDDAGSDRGIRPASL